VSSLPKVAKVLRWGLCLAAIAVFLSLTAGTSRAQLFQRLFHGNKGEPEQASATEQSRDTSDGGYLAKRRYDSLTRGAQYDQAKLLGMVKAFVEKQFPSVTGSAPKIAGAEMVNDDTLCATCHQAYVKLHRTDIHRNQACEACHGPASEHLKTRGTKPGTIISFKTMAPANLNEICLQCHDDHVKDRFRAQEWRTSTHAHAGDACTACHRNHYTVPTGTPATQVGAAGPDLPPRAKETKADIDAVRATYASQGVANSQTCYNCHRDGSDMAKDAPKIPNMLVPGHHHQIDGPAHFECTTCHNPHGVLRKEARTEMCVQCHQQDPKTMPWHASSHAQAGMACVDCHNPHSPLPKLGAAGATTCYKCHTEKWDLEQIAHPHQINGVNGFKCVTCHNPHDNIHRETRVDQCLACHKGHPTMAWKSSTHALQQVACTDCHNPHPNSRVQDIVNIDHNQVDRPRRMPMSVDEPLVCNRCHTRIDAMFKLPFHHPVPEGKMLCSKCHDAHGAESNKLLKQPTVNLTCYKCHSSKQGPFVYEHPPVTENCMICHNPHGTVAKQLLKQPPPFLCLRCHPGHNGSHHVHLGQVPSHRAAFYTDCTQCHQQIHGSDLPGVGRNGSYFHR
jgi:DmsE family decaheme c-type cytochrome